MHEKSLIEGEFDLNYQKYMYRGQTGEKDNLRRKPPDVGVTSGQKPSTKTIYIALQTSVGLF